MPLSQVQPGMNCTGETVVQGTTITSFNVQVIDIVQAPGEGPRILVQVSGPAVDTTGVAEGFSGSPVYCPDSMGTMENAGAISEGIGQYGNNVVLVTPIEQMLGEPVQPPPDTPQLAAKPTPLVAPLTVGGLSPAIFGLVQRAGERAGRMILAAPTGSQATNFPVQPLVPGASVSASYSSGDVPMGAVGTVTYVDGPTVYAFGHELDGAGRRSLLLQDAYVYYVVNNPDPTDQPSYKLAAPGHTEGTLSSDTPNAVIGEVGAPPPTVPVDVTARDRDTGQSLSLDTQVADETDIGLPLGSSLVDTIAPLEVAQAATQIYDGPPADESGNMCLKIYLRETSEPLGFCNRYVGTGTAGDEGETPPELASAASNDVTTAFAGLRTDRLRRAPRHARGRESRGFARPRDGEHPGRARAVSGQGGEHGQGAAGRAGLPGAAPDGVVPVADPARRERTARRDDPRPRRAGAGDVGRPVLGARRRPDSGRLVVWSVEQAAAARRRSPRCPSCAQRSRRSRATTGSYANVPGHGKRRVFRDPTLLITGRTTLPFFVEKP